MRSVPLPASDAGPAWPGRSAWEITRAERVDHATVMLSVAGEFDLDTYGPADEVLRRLEGRDARLVVIDLGSLSFLASTGVRFLLEAQQRADEGGWSLVIVAPPPPADRVLELSCAADCLNITRHLPPRARDKGDSSEV